MINTPWRRGYSTNTLGHSTTLVHVGPPQSQAELFRLTTTRATHQSASHDARFCAMLSTVTAQGQPCSRASGPFHGITRNAHVWSLHSTSHNEFRMAYVLQYYTWPRWPRAGCFVLENRCRKGEPRIYVAGHKGKEHGCHVVHLSLSFS